MLTVCVPHSLPPHYHWRDPLRLVHLDRTIIWNQHQLERLIVDYIDHYNTHRPDRSLGQQPPDPPEALPPVQGRNLQVVKSSRCAGLINEYRNAA